MRRVWLFVSQLLAGWPHFCVGVMSFFNATTTPANTSTAAEKDVEVSDPPTDSISALSFSSQADYLAVGSWDNSVCRKEPFNVISYESTTRSESTKLAQMVKLKGKLCINTKGLSWMFAGTRCNFRRISVAIDLYTPLGRKQNIFWGCRQCRTYVRRDDRTSPTGGSTRRSNQSRWLGWRTWCRNLGYGKLGQNRQGLSTYICLLHSNLIGNFSIGISAQPILSQPFNSQKGVIL